MYFVKRDMFGDYWAPGATNTGNIDSAQKFPLRSSEHVFLSQMSAAPRHTIIPVDSNHHKSEKKLCS